MALVPIGAAKFSFIISISVNKTQGGPASDHFES